MMEATCRTHTSNASGSAVKRMADEYLARMADPDEAVAIGRFETEDETLYVGKRLIRGDHGELLVINWQTKAAAPFYNATFDEPIHMTVSSLEVYTPDGDRADDGDTTLANPEEIAVTLLPGLGSGTYTAVWHVISDDTHPVSGEFTFSIGSPSATHVPALEVSPNNVVSAAFTVIRWLEYMTFALLCGAVAFLISCWPAGARRVGVIRLVTYSWAGLLLSTLLGLLVQGPYAANEGLGQLFNAQLVQATLSIVANAGQKLPIRVIVESPNAPPEQAIRAGSGSTQTMRSPIRETQPARPAPRIAPAPAARGRGACR